MRPAICSMCVAGTSQARLHCKHVCHPTMTASARVRSVLQRLLQMFGLKNGVHTCVYVYMHIYMYIMCYAAIPIYIYRERERAIWIHIYSVIYIIYIYIQIILSQEP